MEEKYTLKEIIYSDLERLAPPTFKNLLRWYFFSQGSTFPHDIWFRILQYCKKRKIQKYTIGLWAYIRERRLAFKYGIFADSNIEIGHGLRIVHCNGVYLNCKSIGRNFTVYQNVTLGSGRGKNSYNNVPVIEDNVTVFPGAVITGNITLHEGCVVGANSFVNKDVEAYTLVAGIPAKKIKNMPIDVKFIRTEH